MDHFIAQIITNHPPTSEWNWFFSTLSQSAAAFIAVVMTYLIYQMTDYNSKYKNLTNKYEFFVAKRDFLKAFFNSEFVEKYNRLSIVKSPRFQQLIENASFFNLDEKKEIENRFLTTFTLIPNLTIINSLFLELRDQFYKIDEKSNKFIQKKGFKNILKDFLYYDITILDTTEFRKMKDKIEGITETYIEILGLMLSLIELPKELLKKLSFLNKSLKFLLFSALILVLLPLLFLPSLQIIIELKYAPILKFSFLILFVLFFTFIYFKFSHLIKNKKIAINKIQRQIVTNKYVDTKNLWPHRQSDLIKPDGSPNLVPLHINEDNEFFLRLKIAGSGLK